LSRNAKEQKERKATSKEEVERRGRAKEYVTG
jgi:hypothetical protein